MLAPNSDITTQALIALQRNIGGEIIGHRLLPIGPYLTQFLPIKPSCEMCRRWHVVHVEPQKEFVVANELMSSGFDAWCPKEPKKVRVRSETYRLVQRPMLPGYVLAGFDVDREPWDRIRGTQIIHGQRIEGMRGVIRMLMINLIPVPIGEAEISRLEYQEADRSSGRRASLGRPELMVGTLVRVVSGPFYGFLGIVVELHTHEVVVELDIFNRKTAVTLEPEQVEAV